MATGISPGALMDDAAMLATIVDVLITQQALFQAQREYARARHAFLVNTLRLKQAAGTIALSDLEEVNRVLVADAEAALDAAEERTE